MSIVRFDFRKNRIFLTCDDKHLFDRVRRYFTIDNPDRFFSDNAPQQLHAITPLGSFKAGLFYDVYNAIKEIDSEARVTISKEAKEVVRPLALTGNQVKSYLPEHFEDRDYQTSAVSRGMKFGRGIVEAATGAGKSAIIYNMCRNLLNNGVDSVLILVPSVQLVTQLRGDFVDYQCPDYLVQMFSAEDRTLGDAPIIISNRQILEKYSKKYLNKKTNERKHITASLDTLRLKNDMRLFRRITQEHKISYTFDEILFFVYNKYSKNPKKFKKRPVKKSLIELISTIPNLDRSIFDLVEKNSKENRERVIKIFDVIDTDLMTTKLSNRLDGVNAVIDNINLCDKTLSNVASVIVDECHGLMNGNNVSEYVRKMKTNICFGFTGTMPEKIYDQWNVIGTLGRTLMTKEILELQDEGVLTGTRFYGVKIEHHGNFDPRQNREGDESIYDVECKYIESNIKANVKICKLVNHLKNNTFVMFTHTQHGKLLYKILKKIKGDGVYFINGEVSNEVRESIRKKAEAGTDLTIVGNLKCVSTGLNIKNLHNIVFASGGRSPITYIQSIGRSLRKHSSKDVANIIDIHHNFHYSTKHYNERCALYKNKYNKIIETNKIIHVD